MKQYEIQLESISPLLMHGSQAIGMEQQQKKKGGEAIKGDPEEWKKTVYFDNEIGVFIPAVNMEASLIEAAKNFKSTGRQSATKYFKAGIFIEGDILPMLIDGKKICKIEDIKVDVRTVKNPATKMRNTRYRAVFDKWSITFRINVLSDDYISKSLLSDVLDYAGMYVGICDFRPRFGRFKVNNIKEVV